MTEILLLRLVHILGATFWVGSGVFSAFFLTPVLMAAGPAAGPVMGGLQQRRLFVVLPWVAVLTILSGMRLMWITSGGFAPAYFATATGATFAASGAGAVAAFLLALLVARPANVRAVALTAELAAAPNEAARSSLATKAASLRRRAAVVGALVLWMLILSAAGMSVARYLR